MTTQEIIDALEPLARLGRTFGPDASLKSHLSDNPHLPTIGDCFRAMQVQDELKSGAPATETEPAPASEPDGVA